MRTDELFAFIKERHDIYKKKESGKTRPWTDDAILRAYRFCNVYRERDTVTQWITNYWVRGNETENDLWFAMVVARLVNWPDSLAEIGFPLPWNPRKFTGAMNYRMGMGWKVFTGAYMIRGGTNPGSKADYLAEEVLGPMWKRRNQLRPIVCEPLANFHSRLVTCRDMGSFMAGQVVADTKQVLRGAPDWWTWAASGPGSKRGLNRVCNNDIVTAPWREWQWLQVLQELQDELAPRIKAAVMPRLCAQNLQNCLCEFDKYERARLGEGRPRSLYPGGA